MWTYRVILLWLFSCLVASSEGGGPVMCRTYDYLQIQDTCRVQNNDLLQAEKSHDGGMVCKRLVEVFFCVAGNVPQCFHNLTEMYNNYFHSPHHCLLSEQQTLSLQNLTTSTAHRQHPENNAQVDVKVDIIVDIIVPVPTAMPEDQPSTEEKAEEGVVRDGDMRHEGQSGSGAAKAAGTIALLVMAVSGVFRMTGVLI